MPNLNVDHFHQKLTLLMLNTEDPLLLVDTNLNIVTFNEPFKNQYQIFFGTEVLKGTSILNYTHPERLENLKKIYKEVFDGRSHETEIEFNLLENHVTTILNKFKPALDENGIIIGAFISSIDITEKKRLLEIQRLSEKRFQALIENTNEIISLSNLEGNVLYVSPAIEKITGFTPKEITDKTYFIKIHPDQVEDSKKILGQLIKNPGVSIPRVHRLLHKEGHYVWVEGTVINLLDNPDVGAIVSNFRDVTEKRTAEEKLKRSESTLKAIFNSTTEAFILLDENYIIKTFNSKANDRNIVAKDIEIGTNILNYAEESKKDYLKNYFEKVLKGETITYETLVPKKDAHSQKWVHVTLSPVKTNNVINGICIKRSDITDRKIIEEELKTSEARFRSLIENSTDMLTLFNENGIMTYISPAVEREFGYSTIKNFSYDIKEIIHPDDIETAQNELKKSLKTPGIPIEISLKYLKKDGSFVWVEGSLTNMLGVHGVNAIVANFKNVNEKVLAEKQKAFEKRDKEALINTTDDLIWSVNKNLNLIAANRAFIKSILITTGKIIKPGDRLLENEFYTHGTISIWQDLYTKALIGTPFKTELFNSATFSEPESWLEISFNPIFNHKEIIGLACYCRNITENKLLQEKLKQSEEQFRGAFNYAAIGMALVGLTGTWLEVNDSFSNMIGYSKEELLGLNFQSLTHPDDLEQDLVILKNLINRKIKTHQMEKRYLHKNGSIIWVNLVVSMVVDQNDKPIHIIGQIQDITQKKITEDALKKSHQLLQKLTDRLPVVVSIFEMTKDGTITFPFMSKAVTQIYPNTNIELLKTDATPIFEKAHPLDKGKLIAAIEESRQNLSDWDLEFRIIIDTKVKWIKGYSKPEKKENDDVVWYGYIEDITDRKLNEESIRVAKERYDIVAKATNDAIYDWDLKTGEVIRTGDGLKVIFGYSNEEVNNSADFWESRIHPEDLEKAKKILKFNLSQHNNHICNQEYRFKKADGTYAFVYEKGYITRDENGTAIRMIGATRDITERIETEVLLKKLNENLEKRAKELALSNSELEQFAYIASHDLQEPLRMVTSFLNLLEARYKEQLDDKAKQYIHFATDGAVRMRKIISDLLEYSQVGRKTDETEFININDLLYDAVQLNRKLIEEKNGLIECGTLPTIKGNKSTLQQVFQNLIGNALKYQKNNARPIIKINVVETKTHWQFSFADNGIGIDERFFDKIFIVFQRLHNKNEYSGTGLGLAICKKIIENHNGKIWVESDLDHGSTFYFTIPK